MKFPRLKKSRGGDGGSSTMSGAGRGVGGKIKPRIKSRIARSSSTKQQQPSSTNTTTQKQPIPVDLPKMEDLLAGNTAVVSASVIRGGRATGGGGDENGGVSMANRKAATQIDTTKKEHTASAGTSLPSQLPPSSSPPPPPPPNDASSPPPPPPSLSARSPLSPRGYPQSSAGTGNMYENDTVLSIHSQQVELRRVAPRHKRGDSAGGGVARQVSPVVDSLAPTDVVPINEQHNVQTTMAAAVQSPAAAPCHSRGKGSGSD